MREFSSFGAFAEHLELLSLEGAAVTDHVTQQGAAIIRDIAKAKIGYYQGSVSEYPAWAPLAKRTEQEKARLGAPAGAPLLRHGELYASIDYTMESMSEWEGFAIIGTESQIGLWQEQGTKTIPPRPFLGPAGFECREHLALEASETIVAWISGKPWTAAIKG